MTGNSEAPDAVVQLAASVPQLGPLPPRPIAWAEGETEWVIVFEDGRKLRFAKSAAQTPAVIDPRAGIANAEASPAGKALKQRKHSRRS